MMLMLNTVMQAPPAVVNLDGQPITHNSGGSGARAGIRFGSDGTVFRRVGVTYTQIDSTTDWIRPVSYASSIYRVRCTNKSVTAWTVEAAAEDVYVDLSVNREWRLDELGGGIETIVCDFEIELNGATLASAQYTFTVDDT